MRKSVLDDVPGLGETRKKRLMREVGSVKAIRAASLDELKSLRWLPDPVAESIYAKLHVDE